MGNAIAAITPVSPGQGPELVTARDLLGLIDQNRVRLRALGGMIISASGMLASASFLMLFFLLREGRPSASGAVVVPLSAALVCLGGAVVFSILAGFIPAPVAATTQLQLVDLLAARFRREHRHAKSAIALLFAAMLLLGVALAVLGSRTLN